jgi:hypothetical protein
MNSFDTADVVAACKEYAPLMRLLPGEDLDPVRAMLAVAAVESGGGDPAFAGHNCGPRFEPAYYLGGSIWKGSTLVQGLVKTWDRAAASSYGPWQCMFDNCLGHTPTEMETNLDICAQVFVTQFNTYVEGIRHAKTLDEVGEVWNLGHVGPDPQYTTKLERAYGLTLQVL